MLFKPSEKYNVNLNFVDNVLGRFREVIFDKCAMKRARVTWEQGCRLVDAFKKQFI